MLYTDLLRAALVEADWALMLRVAQVAARLKMSLYLVGGPVRDCLLRRRVTDLDLTTEGEAITLAHASAHELGGTWKKFDRFGTAKLYLPGRESPLDLATTRTEIYEHPGALPRVTPGAIQADLIRRDFTINAMAIRLDGAYLGELLDQFGGIADLRQGVLRVLHPQSFRDDPTRLFRGARFEQRFGFAFDTATLALIPSALPVIDQLSGDRIRHELELIFRETQPLNALRRLHDSGVLRQVDPALVIDEWVSDRFGAQAAPFERLTCWAWLTCRLDAASLTRVCQRVNLTRDETIDLAQVRALREAAAAIGQLTRRSAVYRALAAYHDRALRAALTVIDQPDTQRNMVLYLTELREVKPALDGRHLQALGLPPGPLLGQVLAQVQDAWLDGDIVTLRQAEDFAQQFISRKGQETV